ncbi:MAG: hypothetical protein MAG453_00193 [Calditrichaeota bacterium]|nr:hypothetical protein [Calditrichota bacterium]
MQLTCFFRKRDARNPPGLLQSKRAGEQITVLLETDVSSRGAAGA